MSPQEITKFQNHILSWYAENKRDLPWRVPFGTLSAKHKSESGIALQDPYKILVSEVMSQQTQIARVIPKYEAWMKVFPTVFDLAKASNHEVLSRWSGLGYNRRALYLKKCAEELVARHASVISNPEQKRMDEKSQGDLSAMPRDDKLWPQTEKELMQLPGIGKYTARAILCFAFNQQIAVVDTNVRKVILTQLGESIKYGIPGIIYNTKYILHDTKLEKEEVVTISDEDIEHIATFLLPEGKAYDWNQALMDYASATLKNQKIAIPKQTTFKGSNRYYRGAIMRALIAHKHLTAIEVQNYLHDEKKQISLEKLAEILNQLEKDALVYYDDKTHTYAL